MNRVIRSNIRSRLPVPIHPFIDRGRRGCEVKLFKGLINFEFFE